MAKEKGTKMSDQKVERKDMSLEEARAYRASQYRPEDRKMSEKEKREQFRIFWAQEKRKYGQKKDLEQILWLHLQAVRMDSPDQFDAGLANFGLKRIGN